MKSEIKKMLRVFIAGLLLFGAGFAGGHLFNGCGNAIDQTGAGADVSGYDAASRRIESAAAAVRDVTRNVSEASGEVRIGIDEAGNIGSTAREIRDGAERALVGSSKVESGLYFIMGILDDAEKRNAQMETMGGSGLD